MDRYEVVIYWDGKPISATVRTHENKLLAVQETHCIYINHYSEEEMSHITYGIENGPHKSIEEWENENVQI